MRACFEAELRTTRLTRSEKRNLRNGDRLPAVIYGKHTESIPIHMSMREFQRWARGGQSEVLEIQVDGKGKLPVLLTDVQREPVSGQWLHADFLHVRLDQLVRVRVQLEFRGTAAGAKVGGIVNTLETHVEVEGLPDDLPASLTVDIEQLDVGQSLTFGDIPLPDTLSVTSPLEELIVTVLPPRVEESGNEEAAVEEDKSEEA